MKIRSLVTRFEIFLGIEITYCHRFTFALKEGSAETIHLVLLLNKDSLSFYIVKAAKEKGFAITH